MKAMQKLCGVFLLGGIWLPALSLKAETFTYVDHWPSGTGSETATEVIVPDGVPASIATATDVTRVERLTALTIGSGASVSYTASEALDLSAAVSGTGTFSASSAGALTLAGDNSNLTAPGCFSIDNTPVVVRHLNGLGSRATGAAVLSAPADALYAANATITFVVGASGVFTNDVALTLNREYTFLAEPRTGRIVQHNDFNKTVGGNVFVGGHLEFCGCKVKSANYLYFKTSGDGSEAHIWLGPDCTYSLAYCLFAYQATLVHFAGTSQFNAMPSLVNAICEGPDVIKDTTIQYWANATLDLQGYDQKTKGFSSYNSFTSRTIKSDKPAVLTNISNADLSHQPKYTGAAGYCHDGTGTETISTALSTSTNMLEVKKGKMIFTSDAGWSGDVVVRSGAVLELSSAKAILGGDRQLTVEADGCLILKLGSSCSVAAANIAGTELGAGVNYTVKKLRDTMGLPVDGDDDAYISVAGPKEWQGWPTTPGARAFVPKDVMVTVGEEDFAKVAVLGEIFVSAGGRVVFPATPRGFELTAAVTGNGKLEFYDSDLVVLNGDSSELMSPGAFFFSNSCVIVSNRYALGSAVTGTCTAYFGDRSDALRFGGAGLTNDVPLQVYKSTVAAGLVLGPDNADETLVLNGGFLVMDNERVDLYLRNRIRIGGGVFGMEKKQWHYINALTDPVELWFDRDSKMRGDKMLWYGNIQMHIGWDEPERVYFIALYTGINGSASPSMTFYGDELLSLGYITGSGSLNLNGHDQTVPMISRQYGNPLHVTSVAPAVLKVTNVSTEDYCKRMNVAFSGAAGFNYSVPGTITNELFDTYSDTTGPLTVSTGALRVTGKAGWGGTNVTVCAGARLIVSSAAAPHMFGDKKVLGRSTTTDLAVEKGGVLELEGGTATVRSYAYDGAFVPAGNYTSASGVGIEGAGVLRVRSGAPCEPGLLLIFR